MDRKIESEIDSYVNLLCAFVTGFAKKLRALPSERWEWQIETPAPSPRMLAEHTWQWLVCDRQHILEPDLSRHADVPTPPDSQEAMCDLLAAESENWRELLLGLTPEQLDAPCNQFGDFPTNVRWFICHMIQNCIYKYGQFSTIYFALGLDGTEPYDAPYPNPFYALMRKGELTKE